MGDTDAIRRLDKALEKKHDQVFVLPSQLAPSLPSESDASIDESAKAMPSRQMLITSTSKHCNKVRLHFTC
jgi:hypothetical protein